MSYKNTDDCPTPIKESMELREKFLDKSVVIHKSAIELKQRIEKFRESIDAYCVDTGDQPLNEEAVKERPEQSDLEHALCNLSETINSCHNRLTKLESDFQG